jgi:hypothetical protein
MSLYSLAASSSRVTKSRKQPSPFKRKSISSAFTSPASLARRSSSQNDSSPRPSPSKKSQQPPSDGEDDSSERLPNHGRIARLPVSTPGTTSSASQTPASTRPRTVAAAISHILATQFSDIPDRAGLNSVGIARILNFRRTLPRIVTVEHVHALLASPTATEKEIAAMIRRGELRRVVLGGGVGGRVRVEGLVWRADWRGMARENLKDYDEDMVERFIKVVDAGSRDEEERLLNGFTAEEVGMLMRAGFLTLTASMDAGLTDGFSSSKDGGIGTATSIQSVSRAASGSLAAVGGASAVHSAGGGAGTGSRTIGSSSLLRGSDLQLSLPNTGAYLKLLTAAKAHMLALLSRSKYNEAPLYLLRERWEGGVTTHGRPSTRGDPFGALLPAKTKKWKDFWGVGSEWVMAELVGSGGVELFDTRSVGAGVRAL